MPIDAFATRRVAQTLQSIGDYLEEGARIARQIKPAQSLELTLHSVPPTPGPLVEQAGWAGKGKVIKLGMGISEVDVVIEGKNLLKVSEVTLVAAPAPSKFFETDRIIAAAEPAVTARITLTDPPAATYHVKVTTSDAQTFLLRNALEIQRPADAAAPGLELGTLIPAELSPGDARVELILLRGRAADLDKVQVTTLAGVRTGWRADIEMPAVRRVGAGAPAGPVIETVTVHMVIPAYAVATIYLLEASTKDGASARIAFSVRPRAANAGKRVAKKRKG